MSTEPFSREAADIVSEASAWIAQLETGELSGADLDAFREWIRRSPRHAAEIKRLAEISMELNVLTEMAEPLREAAMQYQPIVKKRKHYWPASNFVRIVTVMIILGIAFAIFFPNLQVDDPADKPLFVTTAIGDYRELTLSDGTLVRLNTDSQIEVAYDKGARIVRLLNGEAFFDVEPDPDRPFMVFGGENYVRAIGTAFLVRLFDNDFEVAVMEGRVELAGTGTTQSKGELIKGKEQTGKSGTPVTPVTIEAGQSIRVLANRKVSPLVTLSEREMQRELSWQEGLHDFSHTPLEEVVRELSRHTTLEVEIVDPALRDLKFGGIFRTGETKPLFDALEAAFGINVEYVGDNKVRLGLATQE